MLLGGEIIVPTGPPPDVVLSQWRSWFWLLILLCLTGILRLIGMDIAGALLTSLMFCLGVVMIREGMVEIGKYSLMYSVLCVLQLFFDILPLCDQLGGRVTRHSQPVSSVKSENGEVKATYTFVTKTTPFFAGSEGFVYNVQSVAMILSPICMLWGLYLSFSAHREISNHTHRLINDNLNEVQPFSAHLVQAAARADDMAEEAPHPRQTFQYFQG